MKNPDERLGLGRLSLGLAFTILLYFGGNAGKAESLLSSSSAEGSPVVVVELFTSQGCSSCPPADRLLTHIGETDDFAGEKTVTIPLSYHVDYWNRIGWTDPFSSQKWSVRQRRYATALNLRSVYTPQMVVNGIREFVGSNSAKAVEVITSEGQRTAPGWVEIEVNPEGLGSRRLVVDVRANLGGTAEGASAYAVVVLCESGLVTSVQSGENANRTLANDHVVRALERAFLLTGGDRSEGSERVVFDLERDWNTDRLGVVAFLQSRETMEIFGATRVDLSR